MTDPTQKPLRFSDKQREILKAIAETLMPSNVGFPIKAGDDNLVVPMEETLGVGGQRVIDGFGILLYVLEWAALIFIPRLKPFTRLNPVDKEKYLRGWQESRIKYRRLLMLSVKAFVCMIFFSDPAVKAAVGYDTDCIEEASR